MNFLLEIRSKLGKTDRRWQDEATGVSDQGGVSLCRTAQKIDNSGTKQRNILSYLAIF